MIYSLYPHARREGTKEPFIFSMKLFMFGHTNAFTGKYICRKTGIEKGFSGDIKSEIYIFWEGTKDFSPSSESAKSLMFHYKLQETLHHTSWGLGNQSRSAPSSNQIFVFHVQSLFLTWRYFCNEK